MQLFFAKKIESDVIYLDAIDSRHCIKVLRKKEGDQIHITDGKGNHYIANIVDANVRACGAQIESKTLTEPIFKHHLHVAIAPTKNFNRTEWFIEKAVEIGVNEITFFTTQFSERRKINLERVQRIAETALKQSNQFYLPKFNLLTHWNQFIEQNKSLTAKKLIAYVPENHNAIATIRPDQNIIICIGPEGGFHKEEIELGVGAQFECVSLGINKLRTETAGVFACAIIRSNQS